MSSAFKDKFYIWASEWMANDVLQILGLYHFGQQVGIAECSSIWKHTNRTWHHFPQYARFFLNVHMCIKFLFLFFKLQEHFTIWFPSQIEVVQSKSSFPTSCTIYCMVESNQHLLCCRFYIFTVKASSTFTLGKKNTPWMSISCWVTNLALPPHLLLCHLCPGGASALLV